MFDLNNTECVVPKQVIWESPTKMLLDIGDDNGLVPYKLLKGAETYLHKQLEIKPSTSKDLYKKSDELWKELIELQFEKIKEECPDENSQFRLEKDTTVYLVTSSHEIVDIIDLQNEDKLEEFKKAHQKFVIELTTKGQFHKMFADSKSGLIKFILYGGDIAEQEVTPVVMIELDNAKSKFKVYYGILVYSSFTLIPSVSSILERDSLNEFICALDMGNYMMYAKENAQKLYESYCEFESNQFEVSVREFTNILHKVGYKLELDMDNNLGEIKALEAENSQAIQRFYNTFENATALDILQLTDLRQTFKYNKITLFDVLRILSHEYLRFEGDKVTAQILTDIVFRLHDYLTSDKLQTEYLKNDVK